MRATRATRAQWVLKKSDFEPKSKEQKSEERKSEFPTLAKCLRQKYDLTKRNGFVAKKWFHCSPASWRWCSCTGNRTQLIKDAAAHYKKSSLVV